MLDQLQYHNLTQNLIYILNAAPLGHQFSKSPNKQNYTKLIVDSVYNLTLGEIRETRKSVFAFFDQILTQLCTKNTLYGVSWHIGP